MTSVTGLAGSRCLIVSMSLLPAADGRSAVSLDGSLKFFVTEDSSASAKRPIRPWLTTDAADGSVGAA
jgi:hypothetical protein